LHHNGLVPAVPNSKRNEGGGEGRRPKRPKIQNESNKSSETSETTETLSILLKTYGDSQSSSKRQVNWAKNLISQTRIKTNWRRKFIQTGDHKTEMELAAHNAANYLEGLANHLDQTMTNIEENKDKAKDFAMNCFAYLNKVHQGSCIGEAGKIIIDLFEKGELCTEVMEVLMGEAEKLSKTKKLPFANKLTESQKKAIEFMAEEKEERITPVLNCLQTYQHLSKHIAKWNPLLEALVKEDAPKAQKIINTMP